MAIQKYALQGALALLILLLPLLSGGTSVAAQEKTPTPEVKVAPVEADQKGGVDPQDPQNPEDIKLTEPDPEASGQAFGHLQVELPEGALLPDLQTLPFNDIRMNINVQNGDRLLRFSNRVVNAGPGIIELRGQRDGNTDQFTVAQHVYGGEAVAVLPVDGNFYYNQDHTHYHWEGFTAYEIWTVETSGELSRPVIRNDKVGFCLFDTVRASHEWLSENVTHEMTIPDRRVYSNCIFARQGISPGWVDVYRSNISGQVLNISELEDGVYALRAVVDPYGVLYETNSENNDTVTFFALHGPELTLLGGQFSLVDYFALLVDQGKIAIEDGTVLLEE
jgi:hypothetical protein